MLHQIALFVSIFSALQRLDISSGLKGNLVAQKLEVWSGILGIHYPRRPLKARRGVLWICHCIFLRTVYNELSFEHIVVSSLGKPAARASLGTEVESGVRIR